APPTAADEDLAPAVLRALEQQHRPLPRLRGEDRRHEPRRARADHNQRKLRRALQRRRWVMRHRIGVHWGEIWARSGRTAGPPSRAIPHKETHTMKIKDLMTSDPACVTPAETAHEAARLMKEHDAGSLPVIENHNEKRLIGIITDRDIAIRGIAEGKGPDT